jgi:hypothetical protein
LPVSYIRGAGALSRSNPMRVGVIVASILVLSTSSEASKSCMNKTEARQHFGSVWLYWHGKDHCWDATPGRRHHQIRQAQLNVQRKVDRPKWRESMSRMLPDAETVQAASPAQAASPVQAAPWVNRWVDIERPPIDSRWVDIVQVAPPPVVSKPQPMVTPRGVVMVIIIITLTIVIFMIYEGPPSRRRPAG